MSLTFIPKPIKMLALAIDSLWAIAVGYVIFIFTQKTPTWAYLRLRMLYCLTDGKLNKIISQFIGLFRPGYRLNFSGGLLGLETEAEFNQVIDSLRTNGYHVFDKKLPKAVCEQLVSFALNAPVTVTVPQVSEEPIFYDRSKPVATRYQFDEQTVLENDRVQEIVSDLSLIRVAQTYLGAKAICDLVTMWWSTDFSQSASSEAAQLFHFDLDRIKFIKFFIYLTDVDSNTGPHCYVAKSHKTKPKSLRRDGRLQDAEILQEYEPNDIKEIIGAAGSIIAADTSGFHKGKPVIQGDRLIFQVEFCNSLFGQSYEAVRVSQNFKPEFVATVKQLKDTFSRFKVSEAQ